MGKTPLEHAADVLAVEKEIEGLLVLVKVEPVHRKAVRGLLTLAIGLTPDELLANMDVEKLVRMLNALVISQPAAERAVEIAEAARCAARKACGIAGCSHMARNSHRPGHRSVPGGTC